MLEKLAKDVLLPFYRDLFAFFNGIFDMGSNYQRVVFIARRCSNLMEIFFRLSGRCDKEFPPNFITDSAMFSLIQGWAMYYQRNGRFPSILVVDDIVIYGQALDAFLRELEDQLYAELEPYGVSRESVAAALARAVRIRTFARNNQPLLLSSRYQSSFTAVEIMEPVKWRDLSNRISRLILLWGQVNSCFISGAELVPAHGVWEALYQEGFSRIETTYDTFPQTTFCRVMLLPSGETVIYTVRLFSSGVDGSIVAAPFVFLPNSPKNVMNDMLQIAMDKCRMSCKSWFDAAKYQRIKSEAFALLLSTSLLNEFCRLTGTIPRYNGKIKLQMNFGTALNDEMCQFVDSVLEPGAKLLSLGEMDRLFMGSVAYQWGGWGERGWIDPQIQGNGSERLKERLENDIYEVGLDHYARAYWETQMYQGGLFERETDYFITTPELFGQFSESHSERTLPHVVSWVLQMADAGILAITMRTFPYDQTNYVGQCLKTGEQSQFIMPKRLRDFIPILIYIQRKAYIFNRDFRQELYRFANVNEDVRSRMDEIERFLAELGSSGQRLEDWDFDLVTLPNSNSENWAEEMKVALRSLHRQQKLMGDYERLIRV